MLDHGVIRAAFRQEVFKFSLTQMADFAPFKFITRDFGDNQSLLGFEVHRTDNLATRRTCHGQRSRFEDASEQLVHFSRISPRLVVATTWLLLSLLPTTN